jgi:hypothetical protein
MKIIENLPFFSNTPDDTHCFQAGLKMILKFFVPNKEFSFEELDKISAKKEGLYTWPMAALIWMQEHNFEVINFESFDYKQFINKGTRYIFEEFGEEVGKTQIENSDIEQEIKLSKIFLEKIKTQKTIPKKGDIVRLIDKNYVVAVNLNSEILNNSTGYIGHFVIIKGYDDKSFILNDPGLPGMENRIVPFETFEKAWAYPNEKAKNILAFKLNSKKNSITKGTSCKPVPVIDHKSI